LGEQVELPDWQHRWYIAQARLHETNGDLDSALDQLEEAERRYVRTPVPIIHPIAALKTRIRIAQGKIAEALDWILARGLSVDDDISYLREFEHMTLVRVLIAQEKRGLVDGSIHDAQGLLERLLQAAEEGDRKGSVIEILVLQALAHDAQGNLPPALVSLERALTLAEPEGYVRIFVDEGEAMRLLIENQSRNRDHPLSGYVNKLLAAFTQPAAAPRSVIIQKKSDMIEPLSERELEVLKLLRSELSGPEIAGQLIVSLNTFRTHTKNIFNKLGVNNRRAAVRRAEELDFY
jgi:LuxR family maltose regulon positive regulatory protein